MKKYLLAAQGCLLFCISMFGGPSFTTHFKNNNDIFGTRGFVENRGQFNNAAAEGEEILFALDNGLEKIYFTTKGLVYEQTKVPPFTKRERERMERDVHYVLPKPELSYVTMTWQNASKNIKVDRYEPMTHYMSYGEARFHSRVYKRIVYREVYKNIDFEFTIPSDKSHGIKYNVIVHQGGDPSQVAMLYAGAFKGMNLNDKGDVIIEAQVENIIEHAPSSFYVNGTQVASRFILNGHKIGFEFPEGYDRNNELVIDPWVTTISSLTSNNYAYDVDFDFSGNTYIYGGYNPFKVARYNNAGVLQWTFAGTVGSQSWSSAPIVSQASNFAVNKYNSKTYIGQGYVSSGNRVIRLDATGAYDNFINAADNNFQEVWDMGFHCTNDGEVFVLGGGVSSNISAVTINPTTAAISLATFQPTNTGIAQDVASHAIDDAGQIFILYAGSAGLNNHMCLVNPAFNDNIWTMPTTYTPFNEQGNKTNYQGAGSLSSNGFNALAVNANFLFYYDGLNLAAYDKTNGNKVASTTISGLSIKEQGGIAVDDCNNLYLGGVDAVLAYSFNGTAFSAITPIALNLNTNDKYVYDIKLDKANKILYVSGSGFVGTWQAANSLACPTASSVCFNYSLLDHIICAGSSVTLAAAGTGTLNNPSYTLQPLNITNTSGSFVITPTATTQYTIHVSGTNNSQAQVTYSAMSTVSVFPQPTIVPTVVQASCFTPTNSFDLNLSWNPPGSNNSYTINWSQLPNGINSPQQTSASGTIAAGVYSVSVITTWGCNAYATFTINGPPEPSVFFMIPNAPYELTCLNPVLTLTLTPASYNYTTTNSVLAAQTGSAPSITYTSAVGVYTVIGEHPVSKCVSTKTLAVTINTAAPLSVVNPTFQNITCTASPQTITASASPTVNLSHQWISPQNTTLAAQGNTVHYIPGGPGLHMHCAVNNSNGCKTCTSFTVASNQGFPTFTIASSPPNFTLGCSTKSLLAIQIVSASTQPTTGGAVSYTLLPPGFTGSLPGGTLSTQQVYNVSVPGPYTMITRDASNNCDTRVYVSVLTNTLKPSIDSLVVPSNVLNCDRPSVTLLGLSSSPNVYMEWKLPGSLVLQGNSLTVNSATANTSQTVTGTYTFHIMDNNNLCINTQSVTIYQTIIPPLASISGAEGISCATESVVLSNNSTSRVPPFFNPNNFVQGYLWQGPSPQLPLQASSSYVAYMPGTYTLVVKDMSNGCFATTNHTVADLREYPLLLRSNPPSPYTFDCGNETTRLETVLSNPNAPYSYTWITKGTTSDPYKSFIDVREVGQYEVLILNTDNGCLSHAVYSVVPGNLLGGFEVDQATGFAPLTVNITNTSRSTLDTNGIRTLWSFGNGESEETFFAGQSPRVVYTQPGKYKITQFVFKGSCADTVVRYVEVDMPSELDIPNVFTPNGDGINDVFFLHISNISSIDIKISDRWGNVVYELSTSESNIEWNGKNQRGKDVAAGTYQYVLKAKGKDGVIYDKQGTITLVR